MEISGTYLPIFDRELNLSQTAKLCVCFGQKGGSNQQLNKAEKRIIYNSYVTAVKKLRTSKELLHITGQSRYYCKKLNFLVLPDPIFNADIHVSSFNIGYWSAIRRNLPWLFSDYEALSVTQ